jgi:dihydrodiol dehydrogenase / D-xylose 1-dehydrogenase (NADP)
MATRWGITSAGKISHDFVTALSTLPPDEHQVVAVAAQQLDRAKTFATEHKIPNAYGSYEELARDPDVGEFSAVFRSACLYLMQAGVLTLYLCYGCFFNIIVYNR